MYIHVEGKFIFKIDMCCRSMSDTILKGEVAISNTLGQSKEGLTVRYFKVTINSLIIYYCPYCGEKINIIKSSVDNIS